MIFPPVVDLCAATGLFARAFKDEGFPVVQGFELDAARASCWESNLDAPCQVKDVLELKPRDLARHADGDGRLIVIGGVPCQDFSSSNRHATHDTTLRDRVMRVVREVGARPCMENVAAGWAGVDDVQLVRDCDVGGVTIRQRAFWGGPRVEPTHAETAARRLDGRQLQVYRGWGEVIPGADWMLDLTQQSAWVDRGRASLCSAKVPAWTVTTKTDLAVWATANRRNLRFLMPADLAALQGFPADWTFPRTQKGLRGSIGDAVPYAMGRAIARAVRAELEAGVSTAAGQVAGVVA